MKVKSRYFTVAVALLVGLLAMSASAQRAGDIPLEIRELEVDTMRTPEYNVNGVQNRAGRREWLVIATQYETKPEWIDELTFTYYVLFNDEEARPPYKLFRGEVTYTNIKEDRHMSRMYMHPSILERYDEPEYVGLEVKYEGRIVGRVSEPQANERWWERFSPVEGFVLNRTQTPFAFINIETLEAIKQP